MTLSTLTSKQLYCLRWLQESRSKEQVAARKRLALRCWKGRHGFMGDHSWECFKTHARFARFSSAFGTATLEEQVAYVRKTWPEREL